MTATAPTSIPSPCVGLCELGPDGFCVGCLRTGEEIARWMSMNDSERRWMMEHTLAERAAMRR